MRVVEVFAEVACPFTHVGLSRLVARRRELGVEEPVLRVRAWPLELVNGQPVAPRMLSEEITALRSSVAPDLFRGFDERAVPETSLPAMASAAAAYRQDLQTGERFSLAVRQALFEGGRRVGDDDVLTDLRIEHGVPTPTNDDLQSVHADFAEGQRRPVTGSPHFFTSGGDFFCPSLDISHDADGYHVAFDPDGFAEFLAAALD